MNWLFKAEPTHYNYDDLVRDGKTSWTGVRNPVAQKHLRGVKKGDRIFFYHTGDEKAVVGIAKAGGAPYPDPADPEGKLHAVDVVATDPPVRQALRARVARPQLAARSPVHTWRGAGTRRENAATRLRPPCR